MNAIVKPLDWEKLSENCYRAKAPLFGNLRVETYGGKNWLIQWSVPGYCASFVDGDFADATIAKIVAETEYGKQMLKCLNVHSGEQSDAD